MLVSQVPSKSLVSYQSEYQVRGVENPSPYRILLHPSCSYLLTGLFTNQRQFTWKEAKKPASLKPPPAQNYIAHPDDDFNNGIDFEESSSKWEEKSKSKDAWGVRSEIKKDKLSGWSGNSKDDEYENVGRFAASGRGNGNVNGRKYGKDAEGPAGVDGRPSWWGHYDESEDIHPLQARGHGIGKAAPGTTKEIKKDSFSPETSRRIKKEAFVEPAYRRNEETVYNEDDDIEDYESRQEPQRNVVSFKIPQKDVPTLPSRKEPSRSPDVVPFGSGNIKPVDPTLYMKTFNATAPTSEIYPSTVEKISRQKINEQDRSARRNRPVETPVAFRAFMDAKKDVVKAGQGFRTEYQREFLDWTKSLLVVKEHPAISKASEYDNSDGTGYENKGGKSRPQSYRDGGYPKERLEDGKPQKHQVQHQQRQEQQFSQVKQRPESYQDYSYNDVKTFDQKVLEKQRPQSLRDESSFEQDTYDQRRGNQRPYRDDSYESESGSPNKEYNDEVNYESKPTHGPSTSNGSKTKDGKIAVSVRKPNNWQSQQRRDDPEYGQNPSKGNNHSGAVRSRGLEPQEYEFVEPSDSRSHGTKSTREPIVISAKRAPAAGISEQNAQRSRERRHFEKQNSSDSIDLEGTYEDAKPHHPQRLGKSTQGNVRILQYKIQPPTTFRLAEEMLRRARQVTVRS
ncbi:hypothetical protein HDU97_000468 [Phlyctochytrium planicorne]|nr:hypothetical protein HDU97_000468 [Phlyctochytrium planicorne]